MTNTEFKIYFYETNLGIGICIDTNKPNINIKKVVTLEKSFNDKYEALEFLKSLTYNKIESILEEIDGDTLFVTDATDAFYCLHKSEIKYQSKFTECFDWFITHEDLYLNEY